MYHIGNRINLNFRYQIKTNFIHKSENKNAYTDERKMYFDNFLIKLMHTVLCISSEIISIFVTENKMRVIFLNMYVSILF